MPLLHEVVGSYTPLTLMGAEWHGKCCLEEHAEPLAVIGERVRCFGCGFDGDALEFLRAVGEPDPEGALANGRIWTPTLQAPVLPPPKWGLHRAASEPNKTILIVDTREAAKVAERLLPQYLVYLWPGGLPRWKGLEPLQGRNLLLWPSVDGARKMGKLEALVGAPDGLACTGKIIELAEADAPLVWSEQDAAGLIAWAKRRVRPLKNPVPQVPIPAFPAGPGKAAPQGASDEQDGATTSPAPLSPAVLDPEAIEPIGSDLSDSEPPQAQDTDFPADASTERPAKPQSALAAPKPPDPNLPDWPSILQGSKQGYLNNLDNVVRVIENDPSLRGHIWYDEFLDAIVSDWQGPARGWRDSDDVLLQLYVQRHIGLTRISVNTVHDAALVAAFRNIRNECREWLTGLTWDHTDRLAHVLSDAFGAESTTYAQTVGRCWFISMVARVMEPGCKVDTVPVLEGAQGVGKSSALRIIGGKWFAECHESVLTKDWYGVLDGHMLVEISEMHSFTRGEVERVKGLISCQVDRYRKAYGRNTEDHPRQSVLVCTTNRDDWQRDETGARRFWPVLCGSIDLSWLANNRDALFAEAVHLYRNGVQWWLSEGSDQEHEAEKRREADTWEPKLADWLKGRDKVTTGEALEGCFDMPASEQDVVYQRRIARVFRALGWKQRVVKETGVCNRYWLKSGSPSDP